jgi:hypothetical protein
MNAPLTLLALTLVGCAQPSLGPSRLLQDDPMLAALPGHVTLLGGVDAAALDRGALAAPFAARLGLMPSAAPRLAQLSGELDRAVFACGARGCLALAQGDLAEADWCGLAAGLDGARVPLSGRCSPSEEPGLDAATPRGEPLTLRQLAPDKLVMGDRAAVLDAYPQAAGALTAARFDPSGLDGAVPEGELWVLAHRPAALAEQAARRLEQQGAPRALDLAERLHELLGCCEDELSAIHSAALALDTREQPRLTLRITCADGWTARTVERALAERVGQQLDALPLPWREALGAPELLRAGSQVQLELSADPDTLRALSQGEEVAL